MHAHEPGSLDDPLEVIGDPIPGVEAAIGSSILGDFQQLVHLVGADARALRRELGQPLVGHVAGLVDDAHVVVRVLDVEEGLAEVPELGRRELQHGQRRLVHQRRRRVPRLDLLAEDDLHLVGEFRVGPDSGSNRGHEGLEQLCGIALSDGVWFPSTADGMTQE